MRTLPLALGLLSFSVLLFEILLTRLFSVVLLYHFAYVAVSLALLGFSLGALVVHARPALHAPGAVRGTAALCAALCGLSVAGCLLALLHYQPEGVDLYGGLNVPTFRYLAVVYVVATVPFVLAGVCVSALLAAGRDEIGTFYSWDLLGAALGAVAALPVIELLGAPAGVLAAAGAGCASGLLAAGDRRRAAAPGLALALLAVLAVLGPRGELLTLRYSKGQAEERILHERWNSYSRVTALPGKGGIRVLIDSGAATKIWEAGNHAELLDEISTPAMRLRPSGDLLIIGPGGGKDVAAAVQFGMGPVTGVELNPLIVDLTTNTYRHLAGGLWDREDVEMVVDEGRSYLVRSERRWDVVMLTNIDTWAASASGAFTLAENHLYTVEAYETYFDHLREGGLLSITRWHFPDRPHETLRVAALALEVLQRRGAVEPARHVVVLQEDVARPHANVLIKATPFTDEELTALRGMTETQPWKAVYLPGHEEHPEFRQLLEAPDARVFAAGYAYDVSPPSDDRPFFFYVVRPSRLLASFREDFYRLPNVSNLGVFLLVGTLALDFLFVLLVVTLPFLLRGSARPAERTGLLPVLLYFGCLGAGFMIVELALMQKFILFLGHPALALTVVLAGMLLSGGLGSRFAQRVAPEVLPQRLRRWITVMVVLVALAAVGLPMLFEHAMGFARPLRVTLALLCVSPVGFLLGTCLPSGVRLLGVRAGALLPWVWALNGATSVLGSATAMLLAMNRGFDATLGAGLLLYVVAALCVPRLRSPAPAAAG